MGSMTDGIIHEVKKVICGKDNVIEEALTAILAGGHILMEDVPGVGKTTMALAFSKTMGLNFGRVQFTPDVLPSDITGFSMYDRNTDTMKYQPGAIFHNLFLADELNRASSRTQSALLEAMEESNVTVDGKTYMLPDPFIVFATQKITRKSCHCRTKPSAMQNAAPSTIEAAKYIFFLRPRSPAAPIRGPRIAVRSVAIESAYPQ